MLFGLHLIRTDSPSLGPVIQLRSSSPSSDTPSLDSDSLRSAQSHQGSVSFVQKYLLTQIEASLSLTESLSNLLRLMQHQTDALKFPRRPSDSLRFIQIHSVPIQFTLIRSHSLRFKFASDLLRSIQIQQILQSPTDLRIFMWFHSDSLRFTKFDFRPVQIHSISFKFIEIPSATLGFTQIHAIRLHPLSAPSRLIQIHDDLKQICSDKLTLTSPEGKREMTPGPKEKREGEKTPLIRHE